VDVHVLHVYHAATLKPCMMHELQMQGWMFGMIHTSWFILQAVDGLLPYKIYFHKQLFLINSRVVESELES